MPELPQKVNEKNMNVGAGAYQRKTNGKHFDPFVLEE
jgi:hypothetical protein